MNIVNEIRERQNQLIAMINSVFDEMVKKVENVVVNGSEESVEYETVYPIRNVTSFKGNKPIAVIIGGNRKITPTWKAVVKEVLDEVIKNNEMKKRLFDLRYKLLGRKRTRMASTPADMRSPLMICDDLFIETHYDTQMLMSFLIDALNQICYDYSNIKVAIKK